jgi:PhnB protein
MATERSIRTGLAPWLSVSDGRKALEFYKAAFGAALQYQLQDDEGRPIIAQLTIEEADFWVQEDPGSSPGSSSNGSVRMILTVDNPDAVQAQAVAAGAAEVVPVNEGHGWRIGRIVDPMGHHWEIGKPIDA